MRAILAAVALASCGGQSNRLADQSDEDISLICEQHPVTVNFFCRGPLPGCYRAVANDCRTELAQAPADCTVTVDDFIACAEATPCSLADSTECSSLAACGIELRRLNHEGCP